MYPLLQSDSTVGPKIVYKLLTPLIHIYEHEMAKHLAFAKEAFTSSAGNGLYDRARPNYPSEALSKIVSLLPSRAARVVELGSGTGKFSRMLLDATGEGQLEELTCVEPSEGMRSSFEQGLKGQARADKVRVVDGVFDSIPVPDGSADLVIAAQAWHWTGKEQEKPTAEVARVLKKGGVFALIWNLEDRDTAQWVAHLRDAYEKYEQGTPQYRLGWWKGMFETAAYKQAFEPAEKFEYTRVLSATKEQAIERVLSKSYISVLPDDEKAKLTQELERILDGNESRRWINQDKGVFGAVVSLPGASIFVLTIRTEYPYRTDLFVMQRK